MATTVIVPSGPIGLWRAGEVLGFASRASWERGRKFSATTALGMTETMRGSREALRTQFSLLRRVRCSLLVVGGVGYAPCVTDADYVVHVAEGELEELVREDAASVCEPEETVIREDSPQAHGSRMEYCLAAEITQAGVSVDDFYGLSNDNVAEHWEEGEDGGEGGLAVYGPEGNVVDFEAIGEVADSRAALVCVRDDNHLVASINEFL